MFEKPKTESFVEAPSVLGRAYDQRKIAEVLTCLFDAKLGQIATQTCSEMIGSDHSPAKGNRLLVVEYDAPGAHNLAIEFPYEIIVGELREKIAQAGLFTWVEILWDVGAEDVDDANEVPGLVWSVAHELRDGKSFSYLHTSNSIGPSGAWSACVKVRARCQPDFS